MKTLYMKASPEQIAEHVIFSGDPWRVEILKTFLDAPQQVAFSREFNTWTGIYKDLPVTITSTGIGAPSAAIAMEEMYECGMKVALRMGTVMSLHDDRLGHFFVPERSLRLEGTTHSYADKSVQAEADHDFIATICDVIKASGHVCHHGLNATLDGFYSQMRTSRLGKELGIDIFKKLDDLRRQGVDGIDMESACMFVVGKLMGVKTAVLTLATVLENLKETMEKNDRMEAEKNLCLIALESIWTFARRRKE
ncbi:MAG: nucleoside phosphorylase [Acholeplasmataceae bacterium]|nr:nucleoside phosphorylase [Acholeplasmataceae bacterium]